jgi:hypothetical protein
MLGRLKRCAISCRLVLAVPQAYRTRSAHTMKEAVIGAVELLGSTPLKDWEKIIQDAEYDPDPYRRFFTIAAVRDLKIFMTVVARLIPSHIIHSKAQR